MMHHLDTIFGGTRSPSPGRGATARTREPVLVAIRSGLDGDATALHDLAALDSAPPLEGATLVAVVDGTIVAALAVGDGRVIADPFACSAAAVELLRLRAHQLRSAGRARAPRARPSWLAGRARA